MTETTTLRTLLLPELEQELAKTRRMIERLPPSEHAEYKPHEKSRSLAHLAGHTAETPSLTTMILTTPSLDLAAGGRSPLIYQSIPQLLAEYNERADSLLAAFKNTSDEAFNQDWRLSSKDHTIFSGTRYNAYRIIGINHMVHHRAQLGVYLRLLDHKVPATFGPSADESV